ncbi:MAG: haloacid dehalogenase type II [Gammaproteobacteria bacterium]|nr:haloacid dehalogenase type II [Gammaproteobacteria bacterium]
MRARPRFVAFDVIETVFSLERLRDRLVGIGLPPGVLDVWFAHTLRDAFALAATKTYAPFREIAAAALATLVAEQGCAADTEAREKVLDGFAELDPHEDASAAFRCLQGAHVPILALTNGGAEATRKLLQRAGLDRFVQRVISVEGVRHLKPRREVYLHAAGWAGVAPDELALVAAHAWDIHGAGRAGLTTAFVARGRPYPAFMMPPHLTAASLVEVAEALVRLPEA